MKFKEILEKWFKDPKKFLTNMAIVFLIGVLLLIIGDVAGNLLGFGKDKKSAQVQQKKETAENKGDTNEVAVETSGESLPGNKDYEEKMKRELADTLVQIEGVGKVSVMIYFEGSSESIPALNKNDINKKVEEKDKEGGVRTTTESTKNSTVVTVNESGSNKALIVKETRPQIGGVMIVSEGANNARVKEEITNAVKTVLNLPANKVVVSQMKKS